MTILNRSSCAAAVLCFASMNVVASDSNDWKAEANDAWIDGKAEATLLFNEHLNAFDINTDVTDGTVVLTGKVDNDIQLQLAEELVASIKGVTSVDNKLTVYDHDKPSGTDVMKELSAAKIATVVKTKLLFEGEVSGTAINVDVQGNTVTLEGELSSEQEKDLALLIAKNTQDVEKVIDKLTVAPSNTGTGS